MAEVNPINFGTNQTKKSAGKAKPAQLNESLFIKLDKNKDGYISEQELRAAGYEGDELYAMEEAIFLHNAM